MHTLTPAMVFQRGELYMALGSMGGDAQPQIHVQLLSAMFDFGLNPQQAISAPRWRSGRFLVESQGKDQELGGQSGVGEHLAQHVAEAVVLERRFLGTVPVDLERLGHRVRVDGPWEDSMGHAQAIVIRPDTHIFEGAADPRCDSLALGW